jgi:hypothetical protein
LAKDGNYFMAQQIEPSRGTVSRASVARDGDVRKRKRAQRSVAIAEPIKPYPRRGVLAQTRSLPSGSQMLLHLTEFQ